MSNLAVSDIISTNALLYYAPLATTLPATTLAVGGAWPSGWVRAGYSKAPLTFAHDFDVAEAMIEESLAAVDRRKKMEKASLETVIAELTAEALQLSFNAAVTTTAQVETATVGGNPVLTKRMWGFEGNYIDEDGANFPIRLIFYRATVVVGGKLEFGKSDYVGVPLKVEALADMARAAGDRLFQVYKVIEP